MARNKLIDLNNHLFAQLERLNDEELTGEQIENEVKKAKAIIQVSGQIIKASKLTLDAMKLVATGDIMSNDLPEHFALKEKTT